MVNKISLDDGAPQEAIKEAIRRISNDGIPRHVYADGKIMKWNWELPAGFREELESMSLEDHVRRLLEEQNGNEGR